MILKNLGYVFKMIFFFFAISADGSHVFSLQENESVFMHSCVLSKMLISASGLVSMFLLQFLLCLLMIQCKKLKVGKNLLISVNVK